METASFWAFWASVATVGLPFLWPVMVFFDIVMVLEWWEQQKKDGT